MPTCHADDLDNFLLRIADFDAIFYKSLARNDHQWAEGNSNQSGVLIPRNFLSFFGYEATPDSNDSRELTVDFYYRGETKRRIDMRNTSGNDRTTIRIYAGGNRSARPEVHLTNVYNPYFEQLMPGALLAIGREPTDDETRYHAIIIDVDREDLYAEFQNATDLPDASKWGVIPLRSMSSADPLLTADLAPDLSTLLEQAAKRLYEENNAIPSTQVTSTTSWDLINEHPVLIRDTVKAAGIALANNPTLTALKNGPGNLVRWLLQTVEYRLVKLLERYEYPQRMRDVLASSSAVQNRPTSWDDVENAIAEHLDELVTTTKSLTQSRRARAGNSFEWHIYHLLNAYQLNVERQATARRLDFKLSFADGRDPVVLSAKTTVRERWKQVIPGAYFITLDRRLTPSKIENIGDRDIRIVVPEEDLRDLEHYQDSDHIISVKDFLHRYGTIPT